MRVSRIAPLRRAALGLQRSLDRRAEALMREHSRIAQRNLRDVVRNQRTDRLPGLQLIRKRS